MDFLQLILSVPSHLLATGSSIVFLLLVFIIFFVNRAVWQGWRLRKVLRKLESNEFKDIQDPQSLDEIFPSKGGIAHLWREYKKTLYAVSSGAADGISKVHWASTAPAEVVWNAQLAADQQVGAEFFKHLPGMFTGLGIIGTFFGLIEGLDRFEVSSDADVVRGSLESLMHSVGAAFWISAIAITLAIAVTFLEKIALSYLYGKVDAIASNLDRRFPAAVAEKFLELTVAHTEEAATQLKHLKGEILKDLRPILQELSDKHTTTLARLGVVLQKRLAETTQAQLDAARNNNQALGTAISGAITSSLAGPLDEIKTAVQRASGDQSNAAVNMLNDVMSSFSQRLNDLFGDQITGINALNQQAAQTMHDAVSRLDALVVALQDSGQRSSDSMAERMAAAIENMEQRQESINERTREFVEQIKRLVESSQTETGAKLKDTLEELGGQLGVMLQQFQTAQNQAIEAGQQREEEASARTQTAVSDLTGSVQNLIEQIAAASIKMEESITALGKTTTTAISDLNEGAGQVNTASRNFTTASDKVTDAMSQASTVATKLTDLTSSLTIAASSLQQGVEDYKAHRNSVGQLVSDLNGLIASARSDVSMTSDVLRRIEAASQALGNAQNQTEQFMAGVATVLAEAHKSFREAMLQVVRENSSEFHQDLASAVALLGTSIRDLDNVLSTVTVKGRG